jgi:hypothetical protein
MPGATYEEREVKIERPLTALQLALKASRLQPGGTVPAGDRPIHRRRAGRPGSPRRRRFAIVCSFRSVPSADRSESFGASKNRRHAPMRNWSRRSRGRPCRSFGRSTKAGRAYSHLGAGPKAAQMAPRSAAAGIKTVPFVAAGGGPCRTAIVHSVALRGSAAQAAGSNRLLLFHMPHMTPSNLRAVECMALPVVRP